MAGGQLVTAAAQILGVMPHKHSAVQWHHSHGNGTVFVTKDLSDLFGILTVPTVLRVTWRPKSNTPPPGNARSLPSRCAGAVLPPRGLSIAGTAWQLSNIRVVAYDFDRRRSVAALPSPCAPRSFDYVMLIWNCPLDVTKTKLNDKLPMRLHLKMPNDFQNM